MPHWVPTILEWLVTLTVIWHLMLGACELITILYVWRNLNCRDFAEIFGPPLKILLPDRPGSRGLRIPVQYRFNKSSLLVSIPSQFNPDELCGFHGRKTFPYVNKCHTARLWYSHSGIAKDSRHLEILDRKYKAIWYSKTSVNICQSTQRNIPEECPDKQSKRRNRSNTSHPTSSFL